MNWRSWIDLETIRALPHHASGNLAAFSFFKAVGMILDYGLHDSALKSLTVHERQAKKAK